MANDPLADDPFAARPGYLARILADGAQPFRYRSRTRALLGAAPDSGVPLNVARPLPFARFAYADRRSMADVYATRAPDEGSTGITEAPPWRGTGPTVGPAPRPRTARPHPAAAEPSSSQRSGGTGRPPPIPTAVPTGLVAARAAAAPVAPLLQRDLNITSPEADAPPDTRLPRQAPTPRLRILSRAGEPAAPAAPEVFGDDVPVARGSEARAPLRPTLDEPSGPEATRAEPDGTSGPAPRAPAVVVHHLPGRRPTADGPVHAPDPPRLPLAAPTLASEQAGQTVPAPVFTTGDPRPADPSPGRPRAERSERLPIRRATTPTRLEPASDVARAPGVPAMPYRRSESVPRTPIPQTDSEPQTEAPEPAAPAPPQVTAPPQVIASSSPADPVPFAFWERRHLTAWRVRMRR